MVGFRPDKCIGNRYKHGVSESSRHNFISIYRFYYQAWVPGGARFSELGVQVKWLSIYRQSLPPLSQIPKSLDLCESYGSSCWRLKKEGADPCISPLPAAASVRGKHFQGQVKANVTIFLSSSCPMTLKKDPWTTARFRSGRCQAVTTKSIGDCLQTSKASRYKNQPLKSTQPFIPPG